MEHSDLYRQSHPWDLYTSLMQLRLFYNPHGVKANSKTCTVVTDLFQYSRIHSCDGFQDADSQRSKAKNYQCSAMDQMWELKV